MPLNMGINTTKNLPIQSWEECCLDNLSGLQRYFNLIISILDNSRSHKAWYPSYYLRKRRSNSIYIRPNHENFPIQTKSPTLC
uniref:Uncharacterized protein n=1 Tax=Rhizophora mucronata TaxID=61149 RepID=A0A2P2NMR2_RHIMU